MIAGCPAGRGERDRRRGASGGGFALVRRGARATAAALAFFAAAPQARAVPFEPVADARRAADRAFDSRSLRWIALGAAATLGARSVDGGAQAYMNGARRLGDLDRLGNDAIGTGVPGAVLALGLWTYGELRDDAGAARSGQSLAEGLLATGLTTLALKLAVDRERPDVSDKRAFPSGHSSTAFAAASALHEIYGWRVGAPAFALAGLTAASRLSANRHWLSDVVAGAALGLWLGRAFADGGGSERTESGSAARDRSPGAPRSRRVEWDAWPFAFDDPQPGGVGGGFGVALWIRLPP